MVTLIANVITVFGNIIVLYGFFGLPQYGLEGVAWSTVVGRIVAVILLFCLLFYGLRIKFVPMMLIHWSRKMLGKILHIGLPSAGENLVWILHFMTASAFIGLMGKRLLRHKRSISNYHCLSCCSGSLSVLVMKLWLATLLEQNALKMPLGAV